MSTSPRKKTFPTLHTAIEYTSPSTTAATTPVSTSSPSNSSLQCESNNASPPTVPYTMGDMTTGMNHIITEAMVREQLKGGSPTTTNNNTITTTTSPTKKDDSITQYQSPSKRLLKGLSTTCDGSYGQQIKITGQPFIIPSMKTVPVEDVMRWKEFRRKQKTQTAVAAAIATEIDLDGFPSLSEEVSTSATAADCHDDDGNNDDDNSTIPNQQQLVSIALSTNNSEVGTEIASNTARYLAKQSNIMARQLMSSSEEGEEDNDDDWGTPVDVGDDWCSPLDDVEGQDGDIGKEKDCETVSNTNADSDVNEGMSPSSISQQQQEEETAMTSPSKKEVPTMDEVHKFMNQLKQKSAVGRVSNKYSRSSFDNNNNNTSMNSNNNNSSSSRVSSLPPKKSTPPQGSSPSAPQPVNEESNTKPTETKTASSSSSAGAHKSLIEHKERMRQLQLESRRKQQEFDARLQLLRSKLHGEAVDNGADAGRSSNGDDEDLIVPTNMENDSIVAVSPIEQKEKEEATENNDKLQSMPILPGARWSGGLAVWSPSNGGSSSAAKRSKSTPPKLSSPSRQNVNAPQQQQQQSTSPLQLLPMEIGIDEDDFSFSPVDVDAVLGMSSGSMSPPQEMELSSSECFELFTATKSSEAHGDEMLTEGNNNGNVDPKDNDEAAASTSPSPASKDIILFAEVVGPEITETYSEPPSQIAKRSLKSPPSDASPPISNDSTDITEGDKGGGLGSGYARVFGDKSMASSVHVELGFGIGVDPPLDDESSEKENEMESLIGVTVAGSKRRKRKSNSPRTACETVEEQSKDGLKEDESVASMEDEGDGHQRDPSPVAFEPTAKDAHPVRKQLDPDGIVWKEIDAVKREDHNTEPTTPHSSEKKTTDADPEETDNDQVCPDNIFSPRNNNLPPVTPRMTPQANDRQWNPVNHFTPRSKLLTTPRVTPRTVRAANLSSSRKFGFLEDDSSDASFKMNEKPSRRGNKVDETVSDEPSNGKLNGNGRLEIHTPNKEEQRNTENSTPRSNFLQTPRSYRSSGMDVNVADKAFADGDERELEQIKDQNEGRSPTINKYAAINDLRSKFESNTFGINHLQKSLQNIREEKAVGASKSPSPFRANLVDSLLEDSNTPSRIYLMDRELRAMSSLETDTQASTEYSLNKGVSEDNDVTIGDGTLGDGTMDTKKALRYAHKLEKLNKSEDTSKENHEEEVATSSIVALRRKAFENQASESIQTSPWHQNKLDTVGSQKDKGSLARHRSLFNAPNRYEPKQREEACHVNKNPSQDYSSVSLASPGRNSVVASIKERISSYDGQNSKSGKQSPYRLSSQSKQFQGQSNTIQIRVGGQVKNINVQNSPRRRSINDTAPLQKAKSITKTSVHTAGSDVKKEKVLPSWAMNQNKQFSSAPPNNSGAHRFQYGGGGAYSFKNEPSNHRSQATGSHYHSNIMSRVTPIDTRFDDDGDDDGITLSPTISEVSGLTLPTLTALPVPVPGANEYERVMTPIGRLRQKMHQADRFSHDHTDAPTPRRSSMETNSQIHQQESRRDQIVSRIRETSNNGNLWQRRNVVTEVSYSTSGEASSKSQHATLGYPYSKSAAQGMVAGKVAKIDRPTPRGNWSGERVNVSVGDRVAMMNRDSHQHKPRPSMARNSMSDETSSSLATRDCIRLV